MSKLTLYVKTREFKGSNISKRLRFLGKIPAVMYGSNKNILLMVNVRYMNIYMRVLQDDTLIITVKNNENNSYKAIIKEIQRNPLTSSLEHIDFYEVRNNKYIIANVKVSLIGEGIVVKNQNGIIKIISNKVNISVLPKDLPKKILVDVSNFTINTVIRLCDLPLVSGVKYIGNAQKVIIRCIKLSSTK